jgi:hypothetical protein
VGTYSHEQLQRARAEGIRPPVPSRRCTGLRWLPEVVNYATGAVTREGQWASCSAGALAYVPEVAYCAHHMPPALQEVANRRLVLFNELAADLWEDVCREVPVP